MTRAAYSVSSLMVYEACPFQYYYTFIKRIPPPMSPAMKTGVGVHALIADHFRQPQLLPPETEPELQVLLDTFMTSRFNLPPVYVEEPFVLPLARGDIRGRIDVVLPRAGGGLEIVDFKSGSARSRDELSGGLQLPLYALALSRRLSLPAQDLMYTYFFLRDRAEVSFAPSQPDFDQLADRVDDLLRNIESKRFTPSPGCTCYACARDRAASRRS